MSEAITHIAIVDDCLRLLRRDRRMHPAFPAVALRHAGLARLGGTTRWGDQCNPLLLERLRGRWRAEDAWAESADGAKLGFVLGWLSHRAADRCFKIVFRKLDGGCPRSPTDCSVYHDVHVLRTVYGAADGEFAAAVRAELARVPGAPRAAVAELLRALIQQGLLALHTIIPDREDPEGWIDRLLARRQAMTVAIERYAAALTAPDPGMVRRFIDEPRLWCADEPLMRLRQGDGELDGAVIDAALDAAQDGCLYGQALRRAFRYVRAASDFFAGGIADAELARRLDLGKPERIEAAQLA